MKRSVMVRIDGIAAGGAGVGRLPDGRAVFVQRTAPGEHVEAKVVEEKRRWCRAELLAVVEPSVERRDAPCPHYGRCGGCTLEHMSYPAQLRAKASIVGEALRRIARLNVPNPAVVASPAEFRYRNRVSFTLVRLGADRVTAGFHEIDRPGRIVDIDAACLLPEPAIAAVWGRLRSEWGAEAARLPSGRRLRLTLRASAGGGVTLTVDGGYASGRPEELLERVPGLLSIWHRPAGGELRLLAGSETLEESWSGETLTLGGAAFLQVNRAAAALLEQHVLRLAGAVDGLRVIDAYAGVGLHARRLARRGARVVAIESDPDAIDVARRAGVLGARFVSGAVENELATSLPADLVILNPPRTGLDPAVPAVLLAAPPPRILYVSCDPATLARDLSRLTPSYTLGSLLSFDLFPQTSHVETVVELKCVTT